MIGSFKLTTRGIYDEEYLAYLRELLIEMNKEGVVAYIASDLRYSFDALGIAPGCLFEVLRWCMIYLFGTKRKSGAPGWTLEAAGFDLSNDAEKLAQTGAAFLDGIRGGRLEGDRGLWPTGSCVGVR